MVTFKNMGRLGNVLFQISATAAYAWDHGIEFTVPVIAKDPKWHPTYCHHLANPKYDPSLPMTLLREEQHTFQKLPYKQEWRHRNIMLEGYWQTEKYFAHRRTQLLKAFGFPWRLDAGWVSVHVRRGDYLTIKRGEMFKHPPVTKEWYLRAMARFPGFKFRFFSDDIKWCWENFLDRTDCFFSDGKNEVEDLVAGSFCEHHICSASTFSWWQAWLGQNENKKVIMPTHWITPGWNGGIDCSDIVPEQWERMP
jgi:Glycosyl transferase family 11